jgi:hypothetical protein
MGDASWLAIVGAAVGAVIALAGTLVNTVHTDRTQRSRDREAERLGTYADFALALHDAHAGLRDAALNETRDADRRGATGRAIHDSTIYGVRERLLMSGSVAMVKAGETAFHRLIKIRDVVRSGATLSGPVYHDAYHAFAEALWTFRIAVRRERGQRAIESADLGRVSWSEREECPECGRAAVPD